VAWQRVGIVVDGREAEALADALSAEGAQGTEWTDAEAGTTKESERFAEPGAEVAPWTQARVSALFPEGRDASAALDAALAATGIRAISGASVERLEDEDWVARTQAQFDPIAVGRRLWIVPTWHRPPDAGAVNLVLDPGAAFGTGSHPTTRLALEWIERELGSGDTLLDYGCGSGILAIAAMKLGAGAATAVDIDPLALESARYNARRNDVQLTLAGAAERLRGSFRLTVANILANPLRMLAPLLAAHTAPAGRIALSGILEPQAPEVIAAYSPWFDAAVAARSEGWVLVAGTKTREC
jgi:ribosomal protein L11 methyltransferase